MLSLFFNNRPNDEQFFGDTLYILVLTPFQLRYPLTAHRLSHAITLAVAIPRQSVTVNRNEIWKSFTNYTQIVDCVKDGGENFLLRCVSEQLCSRYD